MPLPTAIAAAAANAELNGHVLGMTRSLRITPDAAPLVFCTRCVAYAQFLARQLATACIPKTPSAQPFRRQLASLHRHPKSNEPMAKPWRVR